MALLRPAATIARPVLVFVAVFLTVMSLVSVVSGPLLTPAHAAATGRADDDKVAFTVRDPQINESSGLAVSKRHPGVVYTHNDSGGSPRIFAIGPDGRTKATFTISGANARDWEGMALGPDEQGRPSLFVGDIGDNLGGAWPFITVYRVPEPTRLADQTLRATAFRLKYADGPRNAESLMVHPRTGRLYIASKLFGGALYAAPTRLRTGRTNVLRKVGDAPAIATDGAFSPDGRSLVLRTYFAAHVYDVSAKGTTRTRDIVSLPSQNQGESIAFTADGRSLLAGSEGVEQPVYRVKLPEDALPSPASDGAGGSKAGGAAGSGRDGQAAGRDSGGETGRRDSGGPTLALGGALVIGVIIAFALFRRRA